ncbi:MAG: hypothetical protein ABI910_07715 [Gemmatimonadota bacterium]
MSAFCCATHATRIVIAVASLSAVALRAQEAQPDIFLAPLTSTAAGLHLGTSHNVTARPGYDNQPAFAADGRTLFFTSTREDAQADIYRLDVATGRAERVTMTAPESEYSAAQVPGGGAISVIRVERDSTQRLWRLPLASGEGSVLFPSLKPVGYHAWADADHVVMFVLGNPSALVLGRQSSGAIDTIVFNVGRSLHRIPGSTRVSFVSKAYESAAWVMSLDVATRIVQPLTRLPTGTEDYAWLPDGRLIAGSGSMLLVCDLTRDAQWTPFADLAADGVTGITRLAVSPLGDRLAIVAIPTGGKP